MPITTPPSVVEFQFSPVRNGANTTGTTVEITKMGGATRATVRRCSADISPSRPASAAAAVAAAHATAASQCLVASSSVTSLLIRAEAEMAAPALATSIPLVRRAAGPIVYGRTVTAPSTARTTSTCQSPLYESVLFGAERAI